MRWFTVVAASLAVVASAAASALTKTDKSADASFRAIYTGEWKWRLAQFPGLEGDDTPVADHLAKADAASEAARLEHWQAVLRQVQAIPRDKLSPDEQVNYDVYVPQLKVMIADELFRTYEAPANSDSQFWSDLGYTARRPYRTLADYKSWIAQMRDLPRYFSEETGVMRAGLKRGFTPPRVTLAGREDSISQVASAKPEETFFYEPFKDMPESYGSDREALRVEALGVIRDIVQPAYRDLYKFVHEEYMPGARTTLAAEDLPDGKAFYRSQILEYTTLDTSPEEIHAFGLSEGAKIRGEMLEAMKESGFKGDYPAFVHFLRTDPQFYAKTPQELLMRAAWIAKRFDGKAGLYFGLLPRRRFEIRPVPDDIAPFYTAGRGGTGVFLLNTYNLPSRPLYSLTALTLHESAPGHAFQIPLAEEHKNQPEFRQHSYISAYGEGWALYCERLGDEMGMYETPYERFGMLGYQAWRAARLVVDTGLHSQHWTREQAIKYVEDNTVLSEHEIETEIDRYITWPGQALSYYLGEAAIWKARHKAEAALGAKFNIRAFHDTILDLGSVPIPVLGARVDRFIAEGGKGPYPDLE